MTYLFIYLTPLVNFLLFEAFFLKPTFFYWALIISNLLLIAAAKRITGKKFSDKEFWHFCIFPVIFSSSLAGYSLLLTNSFLVHVLFAVNFFLTWYFLKNIFQGKKNRALENISSYGNLLTIFFLASLVYGMNVFLSVPVWILIAAATGLIALVIYQIFWANKIQLKSGSIYILVNCLVLMQIAWALYFLPFNYNALGLILTICYYMLIGLTKSYFSGKLTNRNIKLYLVSGLSSIIIILLTAKWA